MKNLRKQKYQQVNFTVKNLSIYINNDFLDKEVDEKSSHPSSIFVATINPDSSITEEKKTITPNVEETEVSTGKFHR